MVKIDDIIGKNIVVHCDIEEKANEFLWRCENIGLRWSLFRTFPTKCNHWNTYKNETCYKLDNDGIRCCSVYYYTNHGNYKIVNFNDVSFED